MPDFDVRWISGTEPEIWDDSRLNPKTRQPHRYRRVEPPTAPALALVVLHCVVNGVVAPLDGALGGRLFVASRISWSGSFPFAIVQTPGQSSVITLKFAYHMLGHQELQIRRPEGGAIVVSVDVETA